MNKLDYLIKYLLDEDPQYSEIQIPSDLQGKRDLFRALRNVRQPRPASEEFLRLQDEELQEQLKEKGIITMPRRGESSFARNESSFARNESSFALNESSFAQFKGEKCFAPTTMTIWQGDITRLKVDAIVNAANSQMLGCWGPLHYCIDNAIHSFAGIQLREECNKIMLKQGHPEPTGQAKITKAYNLPCKYVIHTVGPIIPNGIPTDLQREQLASCYRNIMACADENHLECVAFCCISTGEFHFPNGLAAEIAVKTVKDYLDNHPNTSIKYVIFNVFKDIDKKIYEKIL